MAIKTGYWVKIQNNKVIECINYKPNDEKLVSEQDWKEAIEIFPEINPRREIITTHHFDISKTPVEIIWEKQTLNLEERKNSFRSVIKNKFENIVMQELKKQLEKYPDDKYDVETINKALLEFESQIKKIDATNTHDDIDKLVEV